MMPDKPNSPNNLATFLSSSDCYSHSTGSHQSVVRSLSNQDLVLFLNGEVAVLVSRVDVFLVHV